MSQSLVLADSSASAGAAQIDNIPNFFEDMGSISELSCPPRIEVSTVHVSYYNKVYDMLIAWVSDQPFAHNARSSLISVSARHGRAFSNGDLNACKKKPLYLLS